MRQSIAKFIVRYYWEMMGVAMGALIALVWSVPAHAHGYGYGGYRPGFRGGFVRNYDRPMRPYRNDYRAYGGLTTSGRTIVFSDGIHRVDVAPPNACDRIGVAGFESVSGRDAGTCYPSIVGVR